MQKSQHKIQAIITGNTKQKVRALLAGAIALAGLTLTVPHVYAQSAASTDLPHALKPRPQRLHFNRAPSKIGVIKNFVIRDKSREKDLEMRISYPNAAGNYPVLVFSHGAGSSKDGYTQLTEYLANNKFICIQPTHDDSIGKLRQKNFTANIGTALATTNDQKYWINRARDMVAVLDNLDLIANKLPSGVTMDRGKIACGGHSFGAFTTLILAGAPVLIPDGVSPTYKGLTDFGDDRFKAFLVLCGQGTGKVGLCFPSAESYAQIKRPMMVMTGSKDKGQRGQPPEWRMESFNYSKGDNKYLVFINGANHMSFSGNIFAPITEGGRSLISGILATKRGKEKGEESAAKKEEWAPNKPIFSYVQRASLDFLNGYLNNDRSAIADLRNHELSKESRGLVEQKEH